MLPTIYSRSSMMVCCHSDVTPVLIKLTVRQDSSKVNSGCPKIKKPECYWIALVNLLNREAAALIFLSTVVKKSCSVDKFSMSLVQYFSVCLDPPHSPICHLLTLRNGNSILSKQSANENWGKTFKSSFWMRPFTWNQNKYSHSSL